MGKSENKSQAKQAAVVVGALAFGWMAVELAFKPFLDKTRSAMSKSDPNHDPDVVADAAAASETPANKNDDGDFDDSGPATIKKM